MVLTANWISSIVLWSTQKLSPGDTSEPTCPASAKLKLKVDQNYSEVFKSATKQSLLEFKGKKIKIGRARMFEDKTKEIDDPGMYALNKLSQIF